MDKDTLTLIANIAIYLSFPVIAIVFGLAGRSILRAKGYSGWIGFVLGAVFGSCSWVLIIAFALPKGYSGSIGFVLGAVFGSWVLITAFVLPDKTVFQAAPRIPATSSGSYSSSSSSTYDDDNYDPRNNWNSLNATDQGNLIREMERREKAAEDREEFIRGLFEV